MPIRFAPLVPLALVVLLTGCASTPSQRPEPAAPPLESLSAQIELFEQQIEEHLVELESQQLEQLAHSILHRGHQLLGTPYRYGGMSTKTGFDCSGFIGYLFHEEAGIKLPRTTREMVQLNAPRVARGELQPGDIIFFSTRGRGGRVNHAGIYIGDQQFIHSASRRSGVRVDRLDQGYWSTRYLQAKRVLTSDSVPTLNLAQLAGQEQTARR
jgi:lipoprotein Spr